MNRSGFTYSENVLQWVWRELQFDIHSLYSCTGESAKIKIIDPGILNISDGPDFTNARIEIDGIIWHGSVEMHINSKSWYSHGHHLDESYDSVILHVVVEEEPVQVKCKNGNKPVTLNLLPHFNTELANLFQSMNRANSLACANGLNYISEEALQKQIEKAESEYLDQKMNDLLQFYDPSVPAFKAWKSALVLALFDGFGISKNRMPMVEAGEKFLEVYGNIDEKLVLPALHDFFHELNWNYKGVRPHNRPEIRIVQSVKLGKAILNMPEEQFLELGLRDLWNTLIKSSGIRESGRTKILFGTVFIPAVYTLGNLFAYNRLRMEAFREWKDLTVPVPNELLERFKKIPHLNPDVYSGKLGAVHQLRSYCSGHRCHECFVFKKVISS